MGATGSQQGKAKGYQFTSASPLLAFPVPAQFPDWVQVIGAGSTVIVYENDTTSTTITTDTTEPVVVLPGPFASFVSTTATRVRFGMGPMPPVYSGTGSALPAGSAGPVLAISVANQATLSGLAQTVDGVALSTAGQRVFLAKQTTGAQGGLWTVQAGNWTRPADWASGATIPLGTQITVAPGGTTNFAQYGGTWYTDSGAVVDTDTIVFYPATIKGVATLASASPSTVTVSTLFVKSTTTTSVALTNTTTAANGVKGVITAANGTATLVITGPNTVTDVISYTITNA